MKCPHCANSTSHVTAERIDINSGAKQFKGISYNCPHCKASLSVSMDQLALNADLETRIKKMLGMV
jgi:hypothetical protein